MGKIEPVSSKVNVSKKSTFKLARAAYAYLVKRYFKYRELVHEIFTIVSI